VRASLGIVVLGRGAAAESLAQEDLAKSGHRAGHMNTTQRHPSIRTLGLAIITSAVIQMEKHQFGVIQWIWVAYGNSVNLLRVAAMRYSLERKMMDIVAARARQGQEKHAKDGLIGGHTTMHLIPATTHQLDSVHTISAVTLAVLTLSGATPQTITHQRNCAVH